MTDFSYKIGIRLKPPSLFSVCYSIYQIVVIFCFYEINLNNTLTSTKQLLIIEKSLVNPFIEEIIFRGIIYHILYNRYTNYNYCILITSTFFSLFHLINFFNSEYDNMYVILQLIQAFIFGLISNYLLVINNNLISGYYLHIVNNLMSFLVGFNRSNILNHIWLIVVESVIDVLLVFYNYKISTKMDEKSKIE